MMTDIMVRVDWTDDTSEMLMVADVEANAINNMDCGVFADMIIEVDENGEEKPDSQQFGITWTAKIERL